MKTQVHRFVSIFTIRLMLALLLALTIGKAFVQASELGSTDSYLVVVRDDFNGAADTSLDRSKWQVFTDTNTNDWGGPGGAVYLTGDSRAKIDPTSQWTGSGFYTTEPLENAGLYRITAKLQFDHGESWANNIGVVIRNANDPAPREQVYMTYDGPQIRFNIHTPWHEDAAELASVSIRGRDNTGWEPGKTWASPQVTWETYSNVVVVVIEYDASSGATSFKVYDNSGTRLLTQAAATIPAQTRIDIGAFFKVEFAMDGFDAHPNYWDFVEIVKSSVAIRDDFNGAAGATLDRSEWQIFTDTNTNDWGGSGGAVYLTGDGSAKIDPASQWTGSGFYTTGALENSGHYRITAKLQFDHGENWANNIGVVIRSTNDPAPREQVYMTYDRPQIRYNIHTPWHEDAAELASVSIRGRDNTGWETGKTWASPQITWETYSNVVVLVIEYDASSGATSFKVYDNSGTKLLTQAATTIPAQTRANIGAFFKVEFAMDGYDAHPNYWDFVEIATDPVIVIQPKSQIGYWGKSVVFSVTSAGTEPFSYQWFKNGSPILGATNSELVLLDLKLADAGSYSVVVNSASGSLTSTTALLTVYPAGSSLKLYAGVTIDGVVGRTYRIEYTDDLSQLNNWYPATNVTLTNSVQVWIDMDSPMQPKRFYRVVVP